MKQNNISQAETVRYVKIQRLINLLTQKDPKIDFMAQNLFTPFEVGRGITVHSDSITIGRKTYNSSEIKRVTINTEGSMSIYNRSNKKLCGWSRLNLSSKNIELFCIWARKNGIPAETVSGTPERTILVIISALVTLTAILIKILRFMGIL